MEPECVEHAQKTNHRHAQGINSQGPRAEFARQVDLENIGRGGGENRPRKKHRGVTRHLSHLLAELLRVLRAGLHFGNRVCGRHLY